MSCLLLCKSHNYCFYITKFKCSFVIISTCLPFWQRELYGKTPKRSFDAFALTSRVFKIGIKSKTVLGISIRCYGCSVKSKHAN